VPQRRTSTPGDVDSIFYALRPRIIGLLTAGLTTGPQGPAGPKGVNWKGEWAADTDYEQGDLVYLDTTGGGAAELVTYYALVDHTSIAGSPPVPGGNTQWWELGNAYLLLDGSRPMTGDLDMDDHNIDDVKNLTMEGSAVGEAEISNVRQLHLVGDNDDGEARIDGAEWIDFNAEPTKSVINQPSVVRFNPDVTPGTDQAHQNGQVGWSDVEDQLLADVTPDDPVTDDVRTVLGWVQVRCTDDETEV
jgi:hypothetical protein